MTVVLTPKVQMRGVGPVDPLDWNDVSVDVIGSVRAQWGIHSSDPKVRVAEPGTMTFTLDNSDQNKGGARGWYTPGHANVANRFNIGRQVRLILHHELFGDRVMWWGTIADIKPGVGADQTTRIDCVDWMEEAARAKVSKLPVQVDAQAEEIFDLLVDAVSRNPLGGVTIGAGSDVYPFALDNVQDESGAVLAEMQKLALSEFGQVYLSAGRLHFEGRKVRTGSGAVRFAMSEDEQIVRMGVTSAREGIFNRVQVSVHPRRRDSAATTVLFTLGSHIEIPRNTSVVVNCPYRDPAQLAQRVAGVDMVEPVASTDYVFNAQQDGAGEDLTSQLSLDVDVGGNSAEVTITNNGPADGFVPEGGLQLRGRGLYDFEPVLADRSDADSIQAYGSSVYSYDMPYQSSISRADDLAHFLLGLNKDPRIRVETVTFVANWSETEAEQALFLQISDRISIEAPSIAHDAAYYANGFSLDVQMSGLVLVTVDLAPVGETEFWLLEVDGRTELDETTVLGYGLFVPGWILNTSELGTDTFLN